MKKAIFKEIDYYINNCKVADCLRKKLFEYGSFKDQWNKVEVGSKKKGDSAEKIFTKVKLVREDADEIAPIDYFDMMVADAIYSLWTSLGMDEITPLDIHRVMAGDAERTMTKNSREEIVSSVDKLASTRIIIDCKDEMTGRKNGKANLSYDDWFIDCEKIEYEGDEEKERATDKNGREKKQKIKYIINDNMPIYSYAEDLGQIIKVPISLLDTRNMPVRSSKGKEEKEEDKKTRKMLDKDGEARLRKNSRDTDDVVMLKHILIRRIEVMKNGHNDVSERRISLIRRDSKSSNLYTGILPLMGITRTYEREKNKASASDATEDKKGKKINGSIRKNHDNKKEGHIKEYRTASAWTHKKNQIVKHIEGILEDFKNIEYIDDFEIDRDVTGDVKNIKIKVQDKKPLEGEMEKNEDVKTE